MCDCSVCDGSVCDCNQLVLHGHLKIDIIQISDVLGSNLST